MTAEDDDDDDAPRRPRRRRLTDSGGERVGLLDRVRSTVPAMFPGAPPDDLPAQVQLLLAMRTQRLRRFLVRVGIFILLPSLLVLFYTLVIATPRYSCTFQETYQVDQPTATLASAITQSMTSSSDAIDYGSVIVEYIQSGALAEQLDKQLNLRAHYSDPKIDWTSRLRQNATDAQYLSYFNNHVTVSEGFGGYITVNVQGFNPAYTLLLAQTINDDADQMLNNMTSRSRNLGVQQATEQLASSAKALDVANQALTDFRNKHGDFDPSFIATQLGTIEGTLESQLASMKAQLVQAQANLQPNASQIVQLNLQISALEQQIASERQRLADNNGQTSYSNTVADYENLLSNQQLATTTFQSAQQGLVIAQANANAKQNYVVDFVQPVLPDHPTMPDPVKSTAVTFLACLVLYGILNLLFTALRDQTGI